MILPGQVYTNTKEKYSVVITNVSMDEFGDVLSITYKSNKVIGVLSIEHFSSLFVPKFVQFISREERNEFKNFVTTITGGVVLHG